MASISILVTDNETGLINNSYNFTEVEIKRIRDALAYVYRPHLEKEPVPNENNQFVPVPYEPTPHEVFGILAQSLISHILNTCYDTEIQIATEKFKETIPPIELK
jgi:hypothetical protein